MIVWMFAFDRGTAWDQHDYFIQSYYAFLLGLLAFLHVYWLYMFLQIFAHYLKTGKGEDKIDDVSRYDENNKRQKRE